MDRSFSRDGATPNGHGPASLLEVLNLLAVRKRIEILCVLARRPATVEQIAFVLQYAESDISKHLKRLRRAGLVSEERFKKEHVQSLPAESLVSQRNGTLAITLRAPDGDLTIDHWRLSASIVDRLRRLESLPGPTPEITETLEHRSAE